MSRTYKDVPNDIAYERITGHKETITSTSTMSLDDVHALIDTDVVRMKVRVLSTDSVAYTYHARKLITNGSANDATEQYYTDHLITTDGVYWLQYNYTAGQPLPYQLYSVLQQYEAIFGNCVLPAYNADRVVTFDGENGAWMRKHNGFISVKNDVLDTDVRTVYCVIFPCDTVNVTTTYTRRDNVSGAVQHELKKHGFYPYMRHDYDYPNPVFDSHKQRARDTARLKSLVKYANGGTDIDFDED